MTVKRCEEMIEKIFLFTYIFIPELLPFELLLAEASAFPTSRFQTSVFALFEPRVDVRKHSVMFLLPFVYDFSGVARYHQ